MVVQWIAVATGVVKREMEIVDDDWVYDSDEACREIDQRVAERINRANDRMDRRAWRALERLPVGLFYPDTYDLDAYKEFTRPEDRSVQVVVQHGEFIARIPGVRVLERHVAERAWNEPYRVYGDARTGVVALVTQSCIGDSCTCDPAFDTHVFQWSQETFATLDAHPCHGEDEYCEPLDYGFNDEPFPWTL